MSEARWRLSVDQDGVTIAGDRFRLTTAPQKFAADEAVFGLAESAEMEEIVSELEAMTRRTYGQYCGLARAMEILGERWAPMIIRDLLVSAKGFGDLQKGLPRMAESVLSTRLRELEHTGVVRRRSVPVPAGGSAESVVYEVTAYGRELEDIMLRLGRWGAQLLGDPRPEDIVTPDSLVMALRATFQPQHAAGVRATFELHILDVVVHARIEDGTLRAGAGQVPDADLVLEPGLALRELMTGALTPAAAITGGSIRMMGDSALLGLFTQLFQLPRTATHGHG
ncbi:MAG TPA: helix-turn-helix domain-containing protein [Actinophytocola sp.]|uniref:helix-turn-helix domain-containing protein n=1 Tax=Actinophytocola sp. TaxID=1872138 RepID=UPI002DB64881|nr:helix-turn-helix domain-containing protein [Actinophytocola sp.]HEU5475582.1 helix-turn-helix domain-containing protein [Actinophytocola sp.]